MTIIKTCLKIKGMGCEKCSSKISEALNQAERICCLGFGYHPMNLKSLRIEDVVKIKKQELRNFKTDNHAQLKTILDKDAISKNVKNWTKPTVIGTAIKIKDFEGERVKNSLKYSVNINDKSYGNKVTLEDVDCFKLLDNWAELED